MRNVIDTKTIGDYTISVVPDYEPMNPREWDNLGTIYYRHRDYVLGEKQVPDQYYSDILKDTLYLNNENKAEYTRGYIEEVTGETVAIILPLEIYDHSGITIWVGHNPDHHDYKWDCSHVGYIAVTKEKIRKEYNVKRISKQLLARIEDQLRQEIKTFDDFITGNCYGYVIEKNGGEIDSCWGFLGDSDYAMQEGLSSAKWYIERDRKEKQAKTKAYIKNNVPLQARV